MEKQGFGRAGRQGQPGSGEMILSLQDPFIMQLVADPQQRFILTAMLLARVTDASVNESITNLLSQLRTAMVQKLSQRRQLASQQETMLHEKLTKFFVALVKIKTALVGVEPRQLQQILASTELATANQFLVLRDHPITRAVAQQLYAEPIISTPFIEYLANAYLELLRDRWAQWFSAASDLRQRKLILAEYQQTLDSEFDQFGQAGYLAVIEQPVPSFYGWVKQLTVGYAVERGNNLALLPGYAQHQQQRVRAADVAAVGSDKKVSNNLMPK